MEAAWTLDGTAFVVENGVVFVCSWGKYLRLGASASYLPAVF
jgi:hypothetical protein